MKTVWFQMKENRNDRLIIDMSGVDTRKVWVFFFLKSFSKLLSTTKYSFKTLQQHFN